MYFEEHFTSNKNFPFSIQISDHPSRMLAHKHNRTEFMYFYHTEGCKYFCHGKAFNIQSEDLIVSNPCEVHECLHFGNNPIVCCITVAPEFYTQNNSKNRELFQSHVHATPEIREIFENIRKIFQSADKENIKNLFLAGYILQLCGILFQKYTIMLSPRKHTFRQENQQKLAPVFTYIQEHIAEDLSLQGLSQIMHLSTDRFYHIFKEICGISPSIYIKNTRIERACKLLADTEASVTQIAMDCGFCDASYFAKTFKETMRLTPLEYRNSQNINRFL